MRALITHNIRSRFMNITLSADKTLIEKARKYAQKHNITLNNLVRNYLKKIVNASDIDKTADEFETIAQTYAGESEIDYTFNREEIYNRG